MHGMNFTTAAVSVLLLAALAACDSSVGPADEEIQLNLHGTVVSSRNGRPVAGAKVDIGEGRIEPGFNYPFDEFLGSTTSDDSGGFSFSIKLERSRCEARDSVVWNSHGDSTAFAYGLVVMAVHPDYFSGEPDDARRALIDCADDIGDIELALFPRSIAVEILPDSARVRVDSTQDFTATQTYVDGSSSSGPSYFLIWEVTGPPSVCGSIGNGSPARYFAPSAVPQDAACGGGPGQVPIRVQTYDDARYREVGAADTFYVTIIP